MSQLDPKTAFPVPVPDRDTKPFWDGCARGELLIQRCEACGKFLWQPRPVCSSCQTPEPAWTKVSGDGIVASWPVMRPPTLPAYAELVPFVVLLVELKEGKKLERIGFARAIKTQDRVSDRDGNVRRVDITFVLCTWAIELLISVECKSRGRPVSLDDVDQIRVFKEQLPERNLFWVVSEGAIGENALKALKSAGVSAYPIEELELIVADICQAYGKSKIDHLRKMTRMLSMMSPQGYGMSARALKDLELHVLAPLRDVHDSLSNAGSYEHEPIADR